MTIVAATRNSPRTRAFLPSKAATTVLSAQRLQYARGLHSGPWSSHLKTGRDCRRHRVHRYRCMNIISRKLSWDNGSRSHDARLAMKRAMAHLMSDKRTPENPYVNADKVQSWSDDISGLRPGRNIEDAERDAIDHLFRSRGKASYEHDLWMSPLRNIQNYLHSHQAPKDVSPEDVLSATTQHHHSSEASAHKGSPRARRRNSRKEATHAIEQAKRARNISFSNAVSSNASAESMAFAGEVDKYGPSLWNEPDGLPKPTAEEKSKAYADLGKYQPNEWNEPDGLPGKSAEELSKNYSDLDKYKPAVWNEPDGLQPKTSEELSKNYDDLSEYKPVQWHEPDGLPDKSPEELSKNYDDLTKYESVRWNEPDGLPELTPEEKSKQYDDLDKYKPVEWNEPNGLRKPTPEEESKNYEDLDTYSAPFTAPDATIEAHAASQLDATAKAEPLEAKVDVESTPVQYDDLHKYGPVQWNEPDGLQKPTAEELSKNYTDLHMYGAVQWNEPDGLPEPTAEERSKQYEDLPAYEADSHFEFADAPARIHPEEASKQYSDLAAYEQFENDGPSTARVHPEEASKAYDDLNMYRSPVLDAADTAYPAHPEELSKAYQDLDAYKPIYHNEAGASEEHSPSVKDTELNTQSSAHDLPTHFAAPSDPRHKHYAGQDYASVGEMTAAQIRARVAYDTTQQPRQRALDEDMSKYESAWESALSEAQESVKHTRKTGSTKLTGNYLRDFPEDFTSSWSKDPVSSSLLPDDLQTANREAALTGESESKDDVEFSSMDESFPMAESRLEPALDRASAPRHSSNVASMNHVADPYSRSPQGLETSYDEECAGRVTWPTLVKHYAAQSTANEESSKAQPDGTEGVYKVLAYDQATQSVSVAEMTSGVLDQQSPSSPSEVMLKLSNPARFLPHFSSLHSQGYEVVSGSGDVLIFRKVRPGSPDSSAQPIGSGPVNPIDLMGKPVMGNFASPTGFVNYESLADSEALKPEPPFRSNIDVRKEEPVFSGGKANQEQHRTKQRSFGRKLAIGGAWTIGIAYSVGVLAEYFSTGGLDGLGPRGL
ncbi:hypothetical protein CC79DRAFT_1326133 [Sarocladium strictum]